MHYDSTRQGQRNSAGTEWKGSMARTPRRRVSIPFALPKDPRSPWMWSWAKRGVLCNSATPVSKGFRGAEGSFARRGGGSWTQCHLLSQVSLWAELHWCASKHYARENCEYNLNGLRKTLPAAFKSVSTASINRYYQHCCRIIEAYIEGHKYGTEAFVQRAYKSHRRVADKSKW